MPPQQNYPGGAPGGPVNTKVKWYKTRWALGVGCFVLGVWIGSPSSGSSYSSTPAPTVTTTATVTASAPTTVTATAPAPIVRAAATTSAPAAPAASAKTTFGDGTWLVGSDKDIKPGRYKAIAESSCYWERLSDTSGTFDAIVANENVSRGSQAVVTIAASDEAFKSEDCGTWTKVG